MIVAVSMNTNDADNDDHNDDDRDDYGEDKRQEHSMLQHKPVDSDTILTFTPSSISSPLLPFD